MLKSDIYAGDRVIARNDTNGYFYTGRITKVLGPKNANVLFDYYPVKAIGVSNKNIIKYPPAKVPYYKYLTFGDYVMACVVNEFDEVSWVPGVVQTKLVEVDPLIYPKLFTILYFNGQEGENSRIDLIKINKYMYGQIVNYIRFKLGFRSNFGPEVLEQTETQKNLIQKEEYDKILMELELFKKKYKDINGKLKVLKIDFDEWKKHEARIIELNPDDRHEHKNSPRDVIIHRPKPSPIPREPSPVKVREPSPVKPERAPSPQKPRPQPRTIVKAAEEAESITVEFNLEQAILKFRTESAVVPVGKKVLTRWPDDGWYYPSVIKEYLGNYKYIVQDNFKETKTVYREDILTELHSTSKLINTSEFKYDYKVLAMHPEFINSYAPAEVIQFSKDSNKIIVRFYDYVEFLFNKNELIKLDPIKYQYDISKIKDLETDYVGKTVLAKRNKTKSYELGQVMKVIDSIALRHYLIKWSDGTKSLQYSYHIYEEETRKPNIILNDYIMAPYVNNVYLPGRVFRVNDDVVKVEFFNRKIKENINIEECFWISRDYYENACNFYQNSDSNEDNDHKIKVIKHKKKQVYRKVFNEYEDEDDEEDDENENFMNENELDDEFDDEEFKELN